MKSGDVKSAYLENVDVQELTKNHEFKVPFSLKEVTPNKTRIFKEIVDSLTADDLPRPGILMEKSDGTLEIIDGNHRANRKAELKEGMNFFVISQEDAMNYVLNLNKNSNNQSQE